MTGTYEHSIDNAGRLIVPSKLRDKLGASFYLAVGVKENLRQRTAVRGGQAVALSGTLLSEGLRQDRPGRGDHRQQ